MPRSQGFNYLASRGFALLAVGPVDMFPQVCHVETVVLHPSIFLHTERYGFTDFPYKKPPVAYSGDRRFLVVFSVSRSSVYLLITFYSNSHLVLCFHHSAASNSRFLAILETFCLIFALQESLVASIIGCHSKARHVYERIFDNPSNKTA